MPESQTHRRAKRKAAGKSGETEVLLKSRQRLDARTKKKATEIERSGTDEGLKKAIARLKESRRPQKVLQVPQKDMEKAVKAMEEAGASGTVKNLSGTKSKTVKKK